MSPLLDLVGRPLGPGIVAPPQQDPGPLPTRIPAGLVARSLDQANGGARPYISGVVLSDWTWADYQPTGTSTLSAATMTAVINALDWCQAQTGIDGLPLHAMLRIGTGYQAPEWLKAEVGSYVGYGRDGTNPAWASAPSNPAFKELPGGIPRYWTTTYQTRYDNLWALLMRPMNRATPAAGGVGDHPILAGVSNSGPCTQFSEPMIKQYGCIENRQNAGAAGWTIANDAAAYDAVWATFNTRCASLGLLVEGTCSKSEIISPTGGFRVDPARTVTLMERQRAVLGRHTMWSNHGWEGGQADQVYSRMWAGRNETIPVALSLQTRTVAKLHADYLGGNLSSTVQQTIQEAADRGVSWVEIPTGCWSATDEQRLTLAYAQSITPVFRANTAPLMAA